MREIPLTQGFAALVDDEDYERVAAFRWFAHVRSDRIRRGTYARSWGPKVPTWLLMHRFILSALPGIKVDHVDGNGLNNCRSNLRIATESQNQANRRVILNKLGFKGISFEPRDPRGWTYAKPYKAFLHVNGKRIGLGRFQTAEEAGNAYDVALIKHFGDFAATNRMLRQ